MKKILAFTNCSESKEQAIASAKRHVEQDKLRQGTYGDFQGRACSIGCHYGGKKHHLAPKKHGFSVLFVKLCDTVFEACASQSEAAEFHVWVMENVAEGVDTMLIWWEFFALTAEAIGPDWKNFASECRLARPSLKKLCDLSRDPSLKIAHGHFRETTISFYLSRVLTLSHAFILDLAPVRAKANASMVENFKKAVIKFQK